MAHIKADAIVIGSGISGLTTASLLAGHGYDVVLVEQTPRPGGALKRFTRKGIPFDVGFHYTGGLGQGEILHVLWDYLGILPDIVPIAFPETGNDNITVNGSNMPAVKHFFSYERLENELCSLFPAEQKAVRTYFKTVRALADTVPFYNLDLPVGSFLNAPLETNSEGLDRTITGLTSNPALQAVLSNTFFLYGVDPRKISMALHSFVSHGYYNGAYGIKGGGQAIVDAFTKSFVKSTVDLRTNCRISSILVDNGTATGVITDNGEQITAPNVIFTGHPGEFLKMVPENTFRPAYYSRVQDLQNTFSMFVVFAEILDSKIAEQLRWTNYYRVKPGLEQLNFDRKNPEKAAVLLTAPGLRDCGSGNSGAERGAIIMRLADWSETAAFQDRDRKKRRQGYNDWKQQATEKLLAEAEKTWGFVKGTLEPVVSGSPLTFHDELDAPEGCVYGVQHNMNQFVARSRTKVQGLYLSGQSTLMTGVMGASLSALMTVGEMVGMESVWDKVRGCR